MSDIIIHTEEETNDPPIEEIVEEITDLAETAIEELGDAVEIISETTEHECDPHCVELHNRLNALEERVTVTQEHVVAEELEEAINSEPEPEPEPEPTEPEPEPIAEETPEIVPESTLIEPPPNRTEPSGPNSFLRALKKIGF